MPVSTARPTSVSSPRAVACMTTQSASTAVSPSVVNVTCTTRPGRTLPSGTSSAAPPSLTSSSWPATIVPSPSRTAVAIGRVGAVRRARRLSRTVTVPSASSSSPSASDTASAEHQAWPTGIIQTRPTGSPASGASPVRTTMCDPCDRTTSTVSVSPLSRWTATWSPVSGTYRASSVSAGKSEGILSIYSAPCASGASGR